MSAEEHTPGPWDWFTRRTDSKERTEPDCETRHIVGANGQGFAFTVGLFHDEDEANARLIAAAPELLALAVRCESWLTSVEDDAIARGDGREYSQFVHDLRAAIAKATGSAT
jgi:hypothetical protein